MTQRTDTSHRHLRHKGNVFNVIYYSIAAMFLSVLICQNAEAQSQDDYYTIDGTILLTGLYNDTGIIAKSNKVTILLDYETAEFSLYFDISTIRTGIDSLDKLLARQVGNFIEFEGNLGVEYVNTQDNGTQDFNIEGYLDCDFQCGLIHGKGRLESTFGDFYSYILTLSFQLNKNQLPFVIPLQGLHDEFRVDVVQTLIKTK